MSNEAEIDGKMRYQKFHELMEEARLRHRLFVEVFFIFIVAMGIAFDISLQERTGYTVGRWVIFTLPLIGIPATMALLSSVIAERGNCWAKARWPAPMKDTTS